jgi:hypothetical protein
LYSIEINLQSLYKDYIEDYGLFELEYFSLTLAYFGIISAHTDGGPCSPSVDELAYAVNDSDTVERCILHVKKGDVSNM